LEAFVYFRAPKMAGGAQAGTVARGQQRFGNRLQLVARAERS
jgi:hypothetical protein